MQSCTPPHKPTLLLQLWTSLLLRLLWRWNLHYSNRLGLLSLMDVVLKLFRESTYLGTGVNIENEGSIVSKFDVETTVAKLSLNPTIPPLSRITKVIIINIIISMNNNSNIWIQLPPSYPSPPSMNRMVAVDDGWHVIYMMMVGTEEVFYQMVL